MNDVVVVISGKDAPTAFAFTRDIGYAAKTLLCAVLAAVSLLMLKKNK